MSSITCQSDKEKMTVGEHVHLLCTGNDSPDFALAKAAFKLPEHQKYTIKVLGLKAQNEKDFELDFTIYSPGDYKIGDLILTDQTSELSLAGPTLKVESVLKPSPDGKPPEAFGSILPIGIQTPAYYYLGLAFLILIVVGYAAYRVRRNIYYRKLKEKLNKYGSPIEADTQFYRSVRMAEKVGYPLEQVEHAFRLYNLRSYQLPMFDLDNERISKYFRRNYPAYKNTRQNLNKILGEFEELRKNPELAPALMAEFVKKLHRYVSTHKGLAQ